MRGGVSQGKKAGVVGVGGLGYFAVKLATALGGDVTVFATSPGRFATLTRLLRL